MKFHSLPKAWTRKVLGRFWRVTKRKLPAVVFESAPAESLGRLRSSSFLALFSGNAFFSATTEFRAVEAGRFLRREASACERKTKKVRVRVKMREGEGRGARTANTTCTSGGAEIPGHHVISSVSELNSGRK